MTRRGPTFPACRSSDRWPALGPVRAAAETFELSPRREGPRDRELTVADYLRTIVEERWIVVGATALSLALAVAYLFIATPIYESDALVQVEDSSKSVAGFTDLSTVLGDKTPAEGEIEMIRSRTLMEAVAEQLNLDVEVQPRRFPLVGAAVSRRYHGRGPAKPFLGLSSYAWGGERVAAQRLSVSDDLLDQNLALTALEPGVFRLTTEDGRLRLEGRVGTSASGADGSTRVELLVSELVARPGTQFRLTRRRRSDVVDKLQADLRVTEKGKKAGVLQIELDGPDPERVAAIVSAVSTIYLRQNVERKSTEATKTLQFLETQLPVLKSNLDAAEAALNAFKRGSRSVDVTREGQSMLTRSSELDKALSDLELQRSELRQRFTDSHPNLLSLAKKARTLRAERAAIDQRMRQLPEEEADADRLVREVKVTNEMYLLLLNKAQELRVVKSGTIGNVRILDQARVPHRPTRPRAPPVLVIGLLLGLGGGIAGALTRRAFDEGAQDAEEIEAGTGVPVFITIPHSAKQNALFRAARRNGEMSLPLLSAINPEDVSVESLRSLRTGLQFTLVESQNNIVSIISPTAGVGKSFVAMNLAHVFAAAGGKVLLVDADLRRGRLHRHFGLERQPGLSDVIRGTVPLDEAVRSSSSAPNLHVLPTGTIPHNPADLLSSERFERLLKEAAERYDCVIVDTPPILAVTDSALVARLAGVNLLVLRSGRHPIREIASTVKRFVQSGIKVHGAVLNDVNSRGRYGGYAYGYEYSSAPAD